MNRELYYLSKGADLTPWKGKLYFLIPPNAKRKYITSEVQDQLLDQGLIHKVNGYYVITEKGRERAALTIPGPVTPVPSCNWFLNSPIQMPPGYRLIDLPKTEECWRSPLKQTTVNNEKVTLIPYLWKLTFGDVDLTDVKLKKFRSCAYDDCVNPYHKIGPVPEPGSEIALLARIRMAVIRGEMNVVRDILAEHRPQLISSVKLKETPEDIAEQINHLMVIHNPDNYAALWDCIYDPENPYCTHDEFVEALSIVSPPLPSRFFPNVA